MNERPLKIGYVLQHEDSDLTEESGPAQHIRAIVQGLQRRGHLVRALMLRRNRPHWSEDLALWRAAELRFSQSTAFRACERPVRGIQSRLGFPFTRFFDSLRFSDACTSALAGCDILYERFWLLSYGGLMAAGHMGIPVVLEVNGDVIEEYAQLGIRLSRAQWASIRVIHRQMFKRAAHVVAVSDTLKQQIVHRERLDPSKVSVVDNGTDLDLFANRSDRDDTRSCYRLYNGPVIMFVGSFQPWHGVDLLVEAFGRVLSSCSGAKLVMVGDGPLRREMEDLVDSLHLRDSVILTGSVPHDEVGPLLRLADVTVLNPRVSQASMAGSPLKLFEYMAAGKAIVAPAVSNIERVLKHRSTAILVPPDDSQALAGAISELLGDHQLRQDLGQAARQQALEKHSWDHTVSELETIMRTLVNRRRA